MTDNVENNNSPPSAPEKPKGHGINGNLTVPAPGEVRNPNGRPKGTRNRSTIVREMLEAAARPELQRLMGFNLDVPQGTIFEQLVAAQIVKAMQGDAAAFKEMADSGFGKLVDKSETKVDLATNNLINKISTQEPEALPCIPPSSSND